LAWGPGGSWRCGPKVGPSNAAVTSLGVDVPARTGLPRPPPHGATAYSEALPSRVVVEQAHTTHLISSTRGGVESRFDRLLPSEHGTSTRAHLIAELPSAEQPQDLGTPSNLRLAQREFRQGMSSQVIFDSVELSPPSYFCGGGSARRDLDRYPPPPSSGMTCAGVVPVNAIPQHRMSLPSATDVPLHLQHLGIPIQGAGSNIAARSNSVQHNAQVVMPMASVAQRAPIVDSAAHSLANSDVNGQDARDHLLGSEVYIDAWHKVNGQLEMLMARINPQ